MSADWFYADNGNILGPMSFDDATRRMLAAPTATHLVWTQGMPQWADARTLPAFTSAFPSTPPPLPPTPGSAVAPPSVLPPPAAAAAEGAGRHPWRRYFARIFDVYLFFMFGGFALGLMFPELFDDGGQSTRGRDQLFGLIGLAVYVPVEAIMLTAFGSTLGRALYGIRLVPSRGTVTFGTAFSRSATVWLKGMGLGIPIVSLATLVMAYRKLKANGITSWDASQGSTVSHSRLGAGRWIAILASWLGLTIVVGVVITIGGRWRFRKRAEALG